MSCFRQWFGYRPRAIPCGPRRGSFRPALEELERREVPAVTYHGGQVLPHVGVEAVFLGRSWYDDPSLYRQTGQLARFLGTITNSSYMDMLTAAGYGVGRGSYLDGIIDLMNPGSVVSDSQIQQELTALISWGDVSAPDSNRLYFVFVEPGVVVTKGSEDSVTGFYGYHYAFLGPTGPAVNYAVIPYPGFGNATIPGLTAFQQQTEASSHELAEAVTDPHPNNRLTLAWYDDTWRDPYTGQTGAEIGDIVNLQYVYWNGYVVQAEADQNDQGMIPAGATLYPPGSLTASGLNVGATAGRPFLAMIAFGSDSDPRATQLTATIDWGDGSPLEFAEIAWDNGSFTVWDSHIYAQAGAYRISIWVQDQGDGNLAFASGWATVADPAPPPPPTPPSPPPPPPPPPPNGGLPIWFIVPSLPFAHSAHHRHHARHRHHP
jgi:hypothetical protein